MKMLYLLPLISALLWGLVNFIDKYLIDDVLKNNKIGSLVLFSSLSGLPVCFFIFLFYGQNLFLYPFSAVILVVLSGIFFLVAILFYLYALNLSEASVVVPQMLLIPVIAGLLGYLFLGECLTLVQIVGSSIIISGSLLINFHKGAILITNIRVYALMLLDALFAGLSIFLYKLGTVNTIHFWHSIFWEHIGFVLFSVFVLIFVSSYRSDFIYLLKNNSKAVISLNFLSEGITLTGNFIFNYAVLYIPLGIASVLSEGSQPAIVFVLALLLGTFTPLKLGETYTFDSILIKSTSLITLLVGVYLFYLNV